LALSSRNAYLTDAERQAAPVVYRALRAAEELWRAGERDAQALQSAATAQLESEPGFSSVDYVTVVDAGSMAEVTGTVEGQPVMVATAVRLGTVRLIDNLLIG
jgi:pantoate--beta-alanine ligase